MMDDTSNKAKYSGETSPLFGTNPKSKSSHQPHDAVPTKKKEEGEGYTTNLRSAHTVLILTLSSILLVCIVMAVSTTGPRILGTSRRSHRAGNADSTTRIATGGGIRSSARTTASTVVTAETMPSSLVVQHNDAAAAAHPLTTTPCLVSSGTFDSSNSADSQTYSYSSPFETCFQYWDWTESYAFCWTKSYYGGAYVHWNMCVPQGYLPDTKLLPQYWHVADRQTAPAGCGQPCDPVQQYPAPFN